MKNSTSTLQGKIDFESSCGNAFSFTREKGRKNLISQCIEERYTIKSIQSSTTATLQKEEKIPLTNTGRYKERNHRILQAHFTTELPTHRCINKSINGTRLVTL